MLRCELLPVDPNVLGFTPDEFLQICDFDVSRFVCVMAE